MTERAAVRGLRGGRSRARVIAVIAMGVLAAGGLSACRTDAGAAAFVGDTRITQTQVDEIASSIPAATLAQAHATTQQIDSLILQGLTFNVIAANFAKANGYGVAKADPAEVQSRAQQLGVNAADASTNKFALLGAEVDAWQTLLLSKMPKRDATEADVKAVYDELVAGGTIRKTTPFASVEGEIKQDAPSNLAQANDLRQKLNAQAKADNVTVNPRYAGVCSAAPCNEISLPLTELTAPSTTAGGQNQEIGIMKVEIVPGSNPVVLDRASASASPAG